MSKYRINPATALACVALFLSLGAGGAIAASHYLITSIHQIKPSVRRALRAQYRASATTETTYTVANDMTLSPQPITLVAYCHPGGMIVFGGFSGNGDIVTESRAVSAGQQGWEVTAHLDPNYTNATAKAPDVQVWATCH